MSVCTFIASDYPLTEIEPSQDYPLDIHIDDGTVHDGGADDNYCLYTFTDVEDYTEKRNAVYLEWNYTDGRAKQIIAYIKNALQNTDSIELWHVWLMDCYEFEDSPVEEQYPFLILPQNISRTLIVQIFGIPRIKCIQIGLPFIAWK